MGPLTDQDDVQSLIPSASPLMNAAAVHGLDVEKIIGGDPAEIAKAQGLGIPVPGAAPGPAASTPPVVQSALATGAAGQNPPAPAGTSANQPQPPAPSIAQNDTPSYTPGFALDFGRNLAQAQVPATNAPNPPTDTTGAPTVPASISPTGTATSPLAQAFSSAQDTERKIGAMPTEAQTLAQDESDKAKLMSPQSATNPTGIPSPYSPAYRPTKWQRVGRGVLGGLEGLAEHGIAGAALGVVDPAAVGAKAYGAPNRAYSTAEAVNQQGLARVNSQEATAEKTYTAETARLKDLLTSQADLTKAAAAGETADIKQQLARTSQEIAEVRGRLADATQTRADAAVTAANNKVPTDLAGLNFVAAFDPDPTRRAAANAASNRTAAQQRELKSTSSGGVNSVFRQSAIDDAATAVKSFKDSYTYDQDQNMYLSEKGIASDNLTPQEYWDKQNKIVSVLNKSLAQKKLPPLEISPFGPSEFEKSKPAGRKAQRDAARQAAAQPAPAQSAPAATTQHPKRPALPTPTVPAPQGAADMQLSAADGQYHYRDAGKHDLGVVK